MLVIVAIQNISSENCRSIYNLNWYKSRMADINSLLVISVNWNVSKSLMFLPYRVSYIPVQKNCLKICSELT